MVRVKDDSATLRVAVKHAANQVGEHPRRKPTMNVARVADCYMQTNIMRIGFVILSDGISRGAV